MDATPVLNSHFWLSLDLAAQGRHNRMNRSQEATPPFQGLTESVERPIKSDDLWDGNSVPKVTETLGNLGPFPGNLKPLECPIFRSSRVLFHFPNLV